MKGKWVAGFKDFGGMSTVPLVLPAERSSPGERCTEYRAGAVCETDGVKDFGEMSSDPIVILNRRWGKKEENLLA